jgi:hypothetical protein
MRNVKGETIMDTNFNHGSATIHQFPVMVRTTVRGARHDAGKSAADLGLPRICETAIGGAWYHEQAVRESEQASKT